MNRRIQKSWCVVFSLSACFAWASLNRTAHALGFTTTIVQGTVYLANGQPGSGTLQVSWPAFTTANNQAVAAGRMTVNIGVDGYLALSLAPNLGSTPAGLYYTAVFHLSDGTTSTEYWVVPSAAQASLSQVRAQVMPAAQAVQAVSKGYVDQSIQELTQSLLTASGGSLSGPLYLNTDPLQPTQAATKRYVDTAFNQAVPLSGAAMTGPLTSVQLGAAYQVDQFPGADFGAKLQACLSKLDPTYGGTCDARNFTGTLAMGSNVAVSTANATVQLPCATIATAKQIVIVAGTRNVTLHGCALRGASTTSGSQGGTVLLYTGTGAMIQVGDPSYGTDTSGFHTDNVVINTTASTSPGTQGMAAYRTQEIDLANLYFLGNSNQTGMTLDGTGNYTGGTFQDIELGGFNTAINAIGHQSANAMITDWVNASAFLRLHINCPTNGGTPIAGTYGINLQQGDGNTFTGGDVEGCSTALHLGPNAQNNTIVGLRNENSNNQVVADAGSSYNNWIAGGTIFTGQLTDNGTRNSFLDTFHRSFNGLNGDWYGSQKDATITNHFRLGTGAGTERGMLNRYQTDFGYRWTTGLSDATAGEQFYQVLDELNNVYRLSIGQYNNGQASTNNQTVINAAGSGAVVLNGSTNGGTGGVVFGSGGANAATVATINNAGNAQFNGSLQVGGPSTFTSSTTVKNQYDAEIDSFLWAGATANQKESFTYKDYSGSSQWYMVKDTSNNWALNSAIGGLDSFKAYQSTNSGDTYINASNPSGVVRVNYESGSGAGFNVYGGNGGTLYAGFTGPAAIKFPGLAASSGRNCLQIDSSGYLSNTGTNCGTGNGSGTVNSGLTGQIAFYNGNGAAVSGMSSVPLSSGGTGATTAAAALANLGAQAALPGVSSDGSSGVQVTGNLTIAGLGNSTSPVCPNGANGALTTAGCNSGSAPAGSDLQLQVKLGGAFSGTGISVDSATRNNIIAKGTVTGASISTCPAGSAASTCVASSSAIASPALIPSGATGSFNQYVYAPASAYCSVNINTGQLTIFPQQLGLGYASAPTVTWTTDTSTQYTGSLGAIIANVSGGQVTSYSISGANSGWGPASNYYHGPCPISITVAPPATPAAPVKVINANYGIFAYTPSVHPADFGAANDCSQDDTLPVNYAAQYAASKGWPIHLGSYNPNAAAPCYYLGTVTGYAVAAGDTGEAPVAATLSCTTSGGALNTCSVTNAGRFLNSSAPGVITYAAGTTGTGGTVTPFLDSTNHVIASATASGGSGYGAGPVTVYVGPTCSGVPCTVLAPETLDQIGYSVALPSGLTIYGEGATIQGGFTGSAVAGSTYGLGFPYVAAFGVGGTSGSATDRGNNVTIRDLNFKNTFISILNPGSTNTWDHLQFTNVAIPALIFNSQFDYVTNPYCASCMAGIIAGGVWLTRAPTTGSFTTGVSSNEVDNLTLNNFNYHAMGFSSLAGFITARKALDCWYDVHVFRSHDQFAPNSDNCPALYGLGATSIRMPDQEISALWEPDSMWRGIVGHAFTYYSRYGYPSNNVRIENLTDKLGQDYAVISGPNNSLQIKNLNTELNMCNAAGSGGSAVYGTASCPNPYEPYNGAPAGSVLVPTNDLGIYDSISPLSVGGTPTTVAHPVRDLLAGTSIQPWFSAQAKTTGATQLNPGNPIGQEGIVVSTGPVAASKHSQVGTSTQIPSDGASQVSCGARYIQGLYRGSCWNSQSAESYVPGTMPPTFLFNASGGSSNTVLGQVLMPAVKVNGTLGVQGGQVLSFNITNAGSGYPPNSVVTGPGGTFGCTVAASPLNIPGTSTPYQSDCAAYAGAQGTVTSVKCTRCGQGYTSAPLVTIAAPTSGTTATASANIAGIDLDNPLTHLSTCDAVLNAGGTVPANTIYWLQNVTCNGVQYSATGSLKDHPRLEKISTNAGFTDLMVDAWATAANTLTIKLTNPTSAGIAYPAGTSTSPWHFTLENNGNTSQTINVATSIPTITSAPYTGGGGGGANATVDQAVCGAYSFTDTNNDLVCSMTIPANRVPANNLYVVNATCQVYVATGMTSSTFKPSLYFYDSATSTKYMVSGNTVPSSSFTNAAGYIDFTGFGLLAPTSGTGYRPMGGSLTFNYNYSNALTMTGASTLNQPTPSLIDTGGNNQIQIWIQSSQANATPNTATCQITGSVAH